MAATFFLGANSGAGFVGLYEQLLGGALRDLLILKGGPGSGKSSLMRRVARAMEAHGAQTVFIRCSGDPASLDAVIFPAVRAAIVDGTNPHALEPRYFGAAERYGDLGRFCDVSGAQAQQAEIIRLSEAYRASYAEAYRLLRAMTAVEDERRALARKSFDMPALLRRAEGIAARELRGRGGDKTGALHRAFLGGVTHAGRVVRFDTVHSLCPRVYALQDDYGLAAPLLDTLCKAACAVGETAILCPDPLRPQVPQHLLLPRRGLAFVTEQGALRLREKPYRRLRLDNAAEGALSRAERAKLRFMRRISRSLETEAVDALRRAKEQHDALEALYRPLMDFDGVNALTAEECGRFAGYLEEI